MRHRLERPAGIRTDREPLDRCGTVAKRVHLRAGQHDAHRTFQRLCAQYGQHDLILRTQARAESAAHIGRYDAHLVRLHVEHAAEIFLHVLHALRFVVHSEFAAVPDRRRSEQFHGVVVLGRDKIFGLVAHGGGRK